MNGQLDWKNNPQYDEFVIRRLQENMPIVNIVKGFNEFFGTNVTANTLSKRRYNNRELYQSQGVEVQPKGVLQKSFEEVEEDIYTGVTSVNGKSDGSIDVQGVLKMSPDRLADNDYLLEMFGYDKDEWEVVSSSSTVWDGAIKGGKQKMYRCKITVKRKLVPLSLQSITDVVGNVKRKPLVAKAEEYVGRDMNSVLLIPMYDKHFGVNDYNHYKHEVKHINNTIAFATPELTVIALGGDLFHNDSIIHGITTRGTVIEKVDMVQAIQDFIKYFDEILDSAYSHSKKVKVISVAGNHDTTVGYLVAMALKFKWEDYSEVVEFDIDFAFRKAILHKGVMLGFAHGDKARKNIAQIFSNEFPEMWGKSKYREIIVGHLHSGKAEKPLYEDVGGATVRQMASSGKVDDWHKQEGYIMATSSAQTMFYNEHGLIRLDVYPN